MKASSTLRYTEEALIAELKALSPARRVAFAAAAATRQLSNWECIADARTVHRPAEIVAELWTDLHAGAVDRSAWMDRLDEVMALLPDEGQNWGMAGALADDALSSLAYAIRALLTADAQEAAWAARRAYEAADQASIVMLDIQPGTPAAEAAIRAHDIVQREMSRQLADLTLLREAAVDELQRRAYAEDLLTTREAEQIGCNAAD